MAQAAPYNIGSPYNNIKEITDAYTMTVDDDLVIVASGFGGGKAITLPKAGLCTQQNRRNTKRVINLAGGGGSATITAASGDAVKGRVVIVVSDGCTLESDGQKTWHVL